MSEQTVSKNPTPPVSGPLAGLERWLYDMLVVKAPFQIPKNITDWIVQYGPWITLVIGLLFLPALLAVFTIGSVMGGYMMMGYSTYTPLYWVSMAALLVQVAIMFLSIPMLLKRQRNGWMLLFYADLISVVYGVISSVSYGYFALGSLLSTAIGAVIGFYILFQIRSYYTK